MPHTRVDCPRCRQPIMAEVEQLFNVDSDPQAKQKILSGQANFARCQSCGYEGMLSIPIVYHDSEKELLLTYFPPELNVPVNEQEKMVGPLITQVVNGLPNEKKKGYLFQPKTMLTMQTMIETILEADGITREMVDSQQKRLELLQKLLQASEESRDTMIAQEEDLIDEEFFGLMSRLTEISMSQGDQQSVKQLGALQKDLLEKTTVGKQIHEQSKEVQATVEALQQANKEGLTREKLLDLIINAKSDVALVTMVNMAYAGLDYSFFQMLSDKIEAEEGDEKARLSELRENLLEMTKEIEEAQKEQVAQVYQLIEEIMKSSNIEETTQKYFGYINELFIHVLNAELQKARQSGDLDRSSKLQKIYSVIEEASTPPPEYEFIEKLLKTESAEERDKLIEENKEMITPELMQLFSGLISQGEQQQQPEEIKTRMQEVYRSVLRYSMKSSLNNS